MSTIRDIKKPVEQELKIFEKQFNASFKSNIPLLNKVTKYLIRRKGKQMRPIFVMLSAQITGTITNDTYIAANMIELLHTATLIHDDVVDDAHRRRGFLSINALWKNKIAVLVGDFLLSKGLLLALENKAYDLLHIVSDATREMSEGELLQIEKARNLDIEEEVYFEIIKKKTASLIASCCAAGATSAGADKEKIKLMHDIGQHVGVAFQIRDDLFDYQTNNLTGKPNGVDLKEKKLTLPIIYMLNNVDKKRKNSIIKTIRNHHDNRKKVNDIINLVNESGGIKYAEATMNSYVNKAVALLEQFEASDARHSLIKLIQYSIQRKR
ncbi:MAG: polyprenyl synthetase family protein [Bacteroidales bacterium]|nr:polyprenyl synthetase family protein [Bacteroidales bacterium]